MARTKTKKVISADNVIVGNPDQQSIILSAQQVKDIQRSPSEERDLQHVLDSAVSPQDWVRIFANAREQAMNGDKFSIMLLMKYKFGTPAPATPPKQQSNNRIKIVEIETTTLSPNEEED